MRDLTNGRFTKTHGQTKSKLYKVWEGMKRRCNNPNDHSYKHYGGRGITYCNEWNNFKLFYDWALSNGYKENCGLTIDRIDVNGNYCPENCRWVNHKIQNRNYSRNHLITYNGETKCMSDWADEFGIKRATVLFRIKQGKSLDEIFYKGDMRYVRN